MTTVIFLSSCNYENSSTSNYGDCILIDTGSELIIYDCGSEKHAEAVQSYMDSHGYKAAKLILSHNDSDHSKGIKKLYDDGYISEIRTTLLLKYKEELLKRIDDGRKTDHSIAEQILSTYDNIANLSGAPLKDIYENPFRVCDGVEIIGPSKEDMLDAVAKLLDTREGNNMDSETIVNATSIQVKVSFGAHSLLLCGDSSLAAVENVVRSYDAVQLPHHGKAKQAEGIFQLKFDQPSSIYIVSDNTGATNGGSDKLDTTGHRVLNTKNGNVTINDLSFSTSSYKTGRTLGV